MKELIEDLRAQGITKTQMARVMETSIGNVNSWESGRTPRKPEYEQKLRAWVADREGEQHPALIKQPEPDVGAEPAVAEDTDVACDDAEQDDLTGAIEAWHALHVWLAYQPTRIIVPYAHHIAAMYGNLTHRAARDLKQVLALTKASAMLHQASRGVDTEGRIVADLSDYQHAYDALASGIDASAEVRATGNVADLMEHLVTKAMEDKPKSGMPKRGTLKVAHTAVGQVVEYSQRALADAVGMSRTTCQRAVQQAIDGGYIHRRSTKLTASMQLEILHVPHDPQSGTTVLPSPDRVKAVMEGKPDPAEASIIKLTPTEGEGEGGTTE